MWVMETEFRSSAGALNAFKNWASFLAPWILLLRRLKKGPSASLKKDLQHVQWPCRRDFEHLQGRSHPCWAVEQCMYWYPSPKNWIVGLESLSPLPGVGTLNKSPLSTFFAINLAPLIDLLRNLACWGTGCAPKSGNTYSVPFTWCGMMSFCMCCFS